MEILIVPVPLFNKDMAVEAYCLRYQKGSGYLTTKQVTAAFDGVTNSPPLETLNYAGITAFTVGQPVFVPVSSILLLADLDARCKQPPEKVIFLFGDDIKTEDIYINSLVRLKGLGYRIAFQNVPLTGEYDAVLALGDFIFLDQRADPLKVTKQLATLSRDYRNLSIIASGISTMEQFKYMQNRGISLYEGRFYSLPVTKGQREVAPFKANLIRLLNIVQDENFEFESVTSIIQRDPALSISLMRMINSPFLGLSQKVRTIGHAVTLLGQTEVRKWATTSVSRSMGTDKPNEITKLSLIRAKFAENLGPYFGMSKDSQGLFLTGLFSVLDVILDLPMEEALKMVLVSDDIYNALTNRTGRFYPVCQFIVAYERADWASVSREMILYGLSVKDIYKAYVEAVSWYSDLVLGESMRDK